MTDVINDNEEKFSYFQIKNIYISASNNLAEKVILFDSGSYNIILGNFDDLKKIKT